MAVDREPVGQLGHRIDREQRMIDQRVLDRDRAPGERPAQFRGVDSQEAVHLKNPFLAI